MSHFDNCWDVLFCIFSSQELLMFLEFRRLLYRLFEVLAGVIDQVLHKLCIHNIICISFLSAMNKMEPCLLLFTSLMSRIILKILHSNNLQSSLSLLNKLLPLSLPTPLRFLYILPIVSIFYLSLEGKETKFYDQRESSNLLH